MIDDGAVAIGMASDPLLHSGARQLVRPAHSDSWSRTWCRELPWDIVLLFGGGFALAAGFQRTGLALLIGNQFELIGSLPTFVMILLVCLAITFLTELTSNLATTEMILPILAAVAVATESPPPHPDDSGHALRVVRVHDAGRDTAERDRLRKRSDSRSPRWRGSVIVLNLIGAVVITVIVFTVGTVVFDIDPSSVVPEWARYDRERRGGVAGHSALRDGGRHLMKTAIVAGSRTPFARSGLGVRRS